MKNQLELMDDEELLDLQNTLIAEGKEFWQEKARLIQKELLRRDSRPVQQVAEGE